MRIVYTKQFQKHFKTRISPRKNLKMRFYERLHFFQQNSQDPALKNHKLTGKKAGFQSFSVTGDIRVVYKREDESTIRFYDIGTHNQVY